MYHFKEYVLKYFTFLVDYGYRTIYSTGNEVQSFEDGNTRIDILFDDIGYELMCYFSDCEKNVFSLCDGLKFTGIKERGNYQIGDKFEIEKAVYYLSVLVKKFLERVEILGSDIFQEICNFSTASRERALEKYYVNKDLTTAEKCWKQGAYFVAKGLYEKHIAHLSKAQAMKLKYIEKKCRNEIC